MTNQNTRRGFTLIELLVVVLIIGILAAVALPQYRIATEKAHAAEAIATVKALAQAQKVYYLANGEYATNEGVLDISKNLKTPHYDTHKYNWYIALTTPEPEYPRVYAGRDGQGQTYGNGRWYIIYELTNDTLYCAAQRNDINSNKICKTFGSDKMTCLSDHDLNCYPI